MSESESTALIGGTLAIDWNAVIGELKTTPTLQVVVNPLLRRGSPIHDRPNSRASTWSTGTRARQTRASACWNCSRSTAGRTGSS